MDSATLRGTPIWKAELYGKPHLGGSYVGKGVNSYRMDEGARCVCCGRPATNLHHWPPKGTAPTYTVAGHRLRPVLVALCGSGTTGCHGDWHQGFWRMEWVWDDEEARDRWWAGEISEHDPNLFGVGHYELEDVRRGCTYELRET